MRLLNLVAPFSLPVGKPHDAAKRNFSQPYTAMATTKQTHVSIPKWLFSRLQQDCAAVLSTGESSGALEDRALAEQYSYTAIRHALLAQLRRWRAAWRVLTVREVKQFLMSAGIEPNPGPICAVCGLDCLGQACVEFVFKRWHRPPKVTGVRMHVGVCECGHFKLCHKRQVDQLPPRSLSPHLSDSSTPSSLQAAGGSAAMAVSPTKSVPGLVVYVSPDAPPAPPMEPLVYAAPCPTTENPFRGMFPCRASACTRTDEIQNRKFAHDARHAWSSVNPDEFEIRSNPSPELLQKRHSMGIPGGISEPRWQSLCWQVENRPAEFLRLSGAPREAQPVVGKVYEIPVPPPAPEWLIKDSQLPPRFAGFTTKLPPVLLDGVVRSEKIREALSWLGRSRDPSLFGRVVEFFANALDQLCFERVVWSGTGECRLTTDRMSPLNGTPVVFTILSARLSTGSSTRGVGSRVWAGPP